MQLPNGAPSPCNCLGGGDIGDKDVVHRFLPVSPVCLLDGDSGHLSFGNQLIVRHRGNLSMGYRLANNK